MSENIIPSCVVKDKINSILCCQLIQGTKTSKTDRSGEKYLATNEINPQLKTLLEQNIGYKVTAKVDGTCALIHKGQIYKRRDIKPGRKIPDHWIQTGKASDEKEANAHLIGFMPLDKDDKWILDAHPKNENNEYQMDKITVIRLSDDNKTIEYHDVNVKYLEGTSVEIMGPKFQANPHHLVKHCAMPHGSLELKTFPNLNKYLTMTDPQIVADIQKWITSDPIATFVEGVVLHFQSGQMFKLHRHHLDMTWNPSNVPPLDTLKL